MVVQNVLAPIVQVCDVVKSYPVGDDEVTVLKGVSLSVERGEFVSIVGPSGNGKSTLLNMITGIDRPSQGEVVVAGHAVSRDTRQLRSCVSRDTCRGAHFCNILSYRRDYV